MDTQIFSFYVDNAFDAGRCIESNRTKFPITVAGIEDALENGKKDYRGIVLSVEQMGRRWRVMIREV